MRCHLKLLAALAFVLLCCGQANAYLMRPIKYEELFESADLVVIATPLESKKSDDQLNVDQPEKVRTIITTIDTKFEVAYVLKGELKEGTFHFLHLKRKGPKPKGMIFGAVGTFFVDFGSEENKKKSFILFMKKHGKENYKPAWNPMEGSRAIIPVPKDGRL